MARERGGWRITNKGYGLFFMGEAGDENVLELVVEGIYLCEYKKATELYTL